MKITLDTNVLIRSHGRAKGAARRVLEWIERSEHELVLSQSMIYELEEVLGYPQVRKVTGLTDEEMASYVAYVVKLAKLVDLGKPAVFSFHDVDDWMVLRTAIEGEVDVLCTLDGHFRHPSLAPVYKHHGIEVMTDVELLTRLRRTVTE